MTFGSNIVNKDKDLVAATNPITGSIYIVNGGLDYGAKRMFTFNYDLNLYKEINQLVPMESGFAGAWSVERKRMYIHGGIQGTVLQTVLYEFLPSNDAPSSSLPLAPDTLRQRDKATVWCLPMEGLRWLSLVGFRELQHTAGRHLHPQHHQLYMDQRNRWGTLGSACALCLCSHERPICCLGRRPGWSEHRYK